MAPKRQARPANATIPFTPPQRDFIRRSFCRSFGSYRSLAGGMPVSRWSGGPLRGQPRPGVALQAMVASGLVEIRLGRFQHYWAFFTDAGMEAMRQWASAPRSGLAAEDFPLVFAELGLTPEAADGPSASAAPGAAPGAATACPAAP